MDEEQSDSYDAIKAAVLSKFNVTEETYRYRFRSTSVPMGESPDVRTWVKENNPKTGEEAADLTERYLAAHREPSKSKMTVGRPREVPQASTGFSSFELLYGRQVRGPLDMLRENWVAGVAPGSTEVALTTNIVSYILQMRDKLETYREKPEDSGILEVGEAEMSPFRDMPKSEDPPEHLTEDQWHQLNEFAAAYLDDVVIYSESWEEHLQYLKVVTAKIQKSGLTLNVDASNVGLGAVLAQGEAGCDVLLCSGQKIFFWSDRGEEELRVRDSWTPAEEQGRDGAPSCHHNCLLPFSFLSPTLLFFPSSSITEVLSSEVMTGEC
ncbi:olfactory receptor [Sarotherodon galilaeus]